MSTILIFFIKIYQKTISPDHGIFKRKVQVCSFYPTCSEYSIQAFEKYGFLKGFTLTLKRISRCHPWQKNHFDPLK